MNRSRLRYRKLLREVCFLTGTVGFILVALDWLIFPLLLPAAPTWVRIVALCVGLALVQLSMFIERRNKRLGASESNKEATWPSKNMSNSRLSLHPSPLHVHARETAHDNRMHGGSNAW